MLPPDTSIDIIKFCVTVMKTISLITVNLIPGFLHTAHRQGQDN